MDRGGARRREGRGGAKGGLLSFDVEGGKAMPERCLGCVEAAAAYEGALGWGDDRARGSHARIQN